MSRHLSTWVLWKKLAMSTPTSWCNRFPALNYNSMCLGMETCICSFAGAAAWHENLQKEGMCVLVLQVFK